MTDKNSIRRGGKAPLVCIPYRIWRLFVGLGDGGQVLRYSKYEPALPHIRFFEIFLGGEFRAIEGVAITSNDAVKESTFNPDVINCSAAVEFASFVKRNRVCNEKLAPR